MIAILGRGIQRRNETDPVEDISSWDLTEDLELCDKNSAHLPVRAPVDDDSPFCMVGGGNANLSAGLILASERPGPKVMVCAYGGRSQYLESIGAPSESEVMSQQLESIMRENDDAYDLTAEIVVWKRYRQLPVQSNTRQELLNIFNLARERGLKRIGLVTVGVHVPRTATYIAKHLSVYPKYRELTPILLESEEILLHANSNENLRVNAMRTSKSFARNWEREAVGISKIVRDVYGDAKPLVAAAESKATS